MTWHRLKTWPEHFEDLRRGVKTFELRREDDRDFNVGDELILEEFKALPEWVSPLSEVARCNYGYTGRSLNFMVTHLLRGPAFGLPTGQVILSIRPKQEAT